MERSLEFNAGVIEGILETLKYMQSQGSLAGDIEEEMVKVLDYANFSRPRETVSELKEENRFSE